MEQKDGTEGLLLLLDDIWVLFILFLITFLVRTRGLSRYLTYLDFSFFDRHNPALTLIIYISRKIKRLVVGALKKKQNKFYVISSPNSLQSSKDRNLWYKGPTHPNIFCRSYLMKTTVRYVLNNSSSVTLSVLLIVGKKEWKMGKKISYQSLMLSIKQFFTPSIRKLWQILMLVIMKQCITINDT